MLFVAIDGLNTPPVPPAEFLSPASKSITSFLGSNLLPGGAGTWDVVEELSNSEQRMIAPEISSLLLQNISPAASQQSDSFVDALVASID